MTKKIFKMFFLFQILLLTGWLLGNSFLTPGVNTFLGKSNQELENFSFFWSRANFDGLHYLGIARFGYGFLQESFFPLYPKLIALVQRGLGSYLLSGILISNLFLLFSFFLFPKLLALEKIKEKTIKESTLFLFFFSTAFFFGSVYTESLFLFLVLSTFYLARRKKFIWAGLAAGLASYTRLMGIFLLPALAVEYYQQTSKRKMKERFLALKQRIAHPKKNGFIYLLKSRSRHLQLFFSLALSSWGLLVYANFLQKTRGDFFYFAKIQPSFGTQRPVEKLILLYQVFWRYLKMIATVNPVQWIYVDLWLEFLIALFFLLLLAWGWLKREEYRLRNSWLVLATASYFLPALTGTFLSLPRFVLICFPCFVVLSRVFEDLEKKKKWLWLSKAYWVLNLALLILFSAFFFSGYWVA